MDILPAAFYPVVFAASLKHRAKAEYEHVLTIVNSDVRPRERRIGSTATNLLLMPSANEQQRKTGRFNPLRHIPLHSECVFCVY